MWNNLYSALLIFILAIFVSGNALAQVQQQVVTLVINGQSGQAAMVRIEGRGYVDIAALAHIANGTLEFQAKQIVLTLPQSAENAQAPISSDRGDESSMSRDFMKAGIETIASMREWASPLAYA